MERTTNHINDDTGRIAMLEVKTRANGSVILLANQTTITRYQYNNHLGSACLELNENAEVLSYEEFHPFGSTSYSKHSNDSEVSLKRYKYNGKERDDESGLDFYGARYYANWLCRFVSVDPLKDNYPFQNSFAYAANSPITLTDVNGEGPGGGEDENELQTHKVVKGDTYSELSQRYGVSVDNLRDWNGYADTQIPVGSTLTVSDPSQQKGANDPSNNLLVSDIEVGTKLNTEAGAVPLPKSPQWEIWRNPKPTPSPSPAIGVGGLLLRIVGTIGLVLLPTPMGSGDTNPHTGPLPSLEELDEKDDTVTLYRGVGSNSGQIYDYAVLGLAVPKGLIPDLSGKTPHTNPNDHTYGDNYSLMTSWSVYQDFAESAALRESSSGVVLSITVNRSELIKSTASKNPIFEDEGEYQLFGIRKANSTYFINK